MNKQLIILALILHIFSTYYVHVIGSDHYHPSKSAKRKLDKVWDVCHKFFPNISHLEDLNNVILLVPLVIALCSNTTSNIVKDVIHYFPIILIIRSICIFVTILPKHKRCHQPFSLKSLLVGHCYDKVFSGHFSLFLLMTLILFRNNVIGLNYVIVLNLLCAMSILLTRSHYTTDIIIALLVTHSVYNNCYFSRS